ncbi:UDP-glucose 4-epimerase [Mycetocola manganoxydans]|nr:UDP-glucose 4-epimerase [Mycetocola manganoxydans]
MTGGAGYIGSHTAIELLARGHSVDIVDNLSNGNAEAVRRIRRLSDRTVGFYQMDLNDESELARVLGEGEFDACVHMAGHKSVAESVADPIEYYRNNIGSTLTLMRGLQEHGVRKFVFSSSATVYGDASKSPLTEENPTGVGITNPYGQSKFMIEQILRDVARADTEMRIAVLRYFNPVGAHESGELGEDPRGMPNNLLPYVSQVAIGRRDYVSVFGSGYPTPDGTGVRDYIHVVDLAMGHVAALEQLAPGLDSFNLGTGTGTSVLELIDAFAHACGREIPYRVVGPRTGDVAESVASVDKARRILQWAASRTVKDACIDSWRWQSNNPNGFPSTGS